MSDLSERLVTVAEAAIDGHHRAHLGEARDAVVAVLREFIEHLEAIAHHEYRSELALGIYRAVDEARSAADEIETGGA